MFDENKALWGSWAVIGKNGNKYWFGGQEPSTRGRELHAQIKGFNHYFECLLFSILF